MRAVILAGIPVSMVTGESARDRRCCRCVSRHRRPCVAVESDVGFISGRFTLAGSCNLLQHGAFVGVLGAEPYLVIRPWLIGPPWFRRRIVGLGCAAVVGSMLLQPRWLAMSLFIAFPALFGITIGPAIETIEQRPPPTADAGTRHRPHCSPPAQRPHQHAALTMTIRAAWLAIALADLLALIADIQALANMRTS